MYKFNFDKILKELPNVRRDILVKLSNQAERSFLSNFETQSFDGQPWDDVQRRDPNKPAYKYPKSKGLSRRTNPILTGSGYGLGKGVTSRGGNLRKRVGLMSQTAQYIGNNQIKMTLQGADYGIYINEGTNKMVKRQFVGQTEKLTQKQKKTLNRIILKEFEAK